MNEPTPSTTELCHLRVQVDQLDRQLLHLLAQRFQLVQQIGQHKTDTAAVPAYERLLPMLQARGDQAKALGLDGDFVARLFQQIAHHAMALQRQQLSSSSTELPLVYSCSGCSSSAQLANDLAVALDREQQAEMSCITGVGGDVPALVKTAVSGRFILVIDGCSRRCAQRCLARHGIAADQHVVLSKLGIGKRLHQDYRAEEMLQAKHHLIELLQVTADKPGVNH